MHGVYWASFSLEMTQRPVKSHLNTRLNPLIAKNSVSYSARNKRTDLCMIDKFGQETEHHPKHTKL